MSKLAALVSLMAAITWATTPDARAMTLEVNDSRDAGDAAPGDGTCEATRGAHDCTARAAIQEANATPGADTIELPAGVFAIGIPGESEDESATGDLDIQDSLILHGAGRDRTVLDGAGLDRVLDVPRSAHHVVVLLEGLTLRSGSHGGMRFLATGDLSLHDCAVIDNDSPAAGGGLYVSSGNVSLVRTTVSMNRAAMQGGGIRIHAGMLSLQDSEVSGNTIASLRPAGIDATRSSVSIARGFVQDLSPFCPARLVAATLHR
jgi:hypothetical protein